MMELLYATILQMLMTNFLCHTLQLGGVGLGVIVLGFRLLLAASIQNDSNRP